LQKLWDKASSFTKLEAEPGGVTPKKSKGKQRSQSQFEAQLKKQRQAAQGKSAGQGGQGAPASAAQDAGAVSKGADSQRASSRAPVTDMAILEPTKERPNGTVAIELDPNSNILVNMDKAGNVNLTITGPDGEKQRILMLKQENGGYQVLRSKGDIDSKRSEDWQNMGTTAGPGMPEIGLQDTNGKLVSQGRISAVGGLSYPPELADNIIVAGPDGKAVSLAAASQLFADGEYGDPGPGTGRH
jgi:hypothetical protein